MSDECGDVRAVPIVYNGTAEATFVPLAEGQRIAIGELHGCSGVLIAPTWVLSATHCGYQAGAEFCMGESPANPDTCVASVNIYSNADLTLLELESDARVAMPGVMPIPILAEDMDNGWIGRIAEAAGYGLQEDGHSGEREFTAEPIVWFSNDEIWVNGEGVHGLCFGDSGGPLLVIASGGTTRVAGALSAGDVGCLGWDSYARADLYRDWIEDHTGPAVPTEGCGGLDTTGRCFDGRAIWCENDATRDEVCANGNECGWSDADGGYRCVPAADNACDGLDGFGICAEGVAQWCERGQPRSRDCGACDQRCVVATPQGGAYCAVDHCGGLDFLGRCTGNTAEWCYNGEPESVDCAASGQICGWVDDQNGYYCM